MTDDEITRLCNVLGSLGGRVDPFAKQLESEAKTFEKMRKTCLEYITLCNTKLEASEKKMMKTLEILNTTWGGDTRWQNESCKLARNTFEQRVEIP